MLEARSVGVRYRNGAIGIEDVSLEVAAGEIISLSGANGAGKTTTARALSGFLRTEGVHISGVVLFEGQDVTRLEPHRRSQLGIAVVPERVKIFPNLTVHENLMAVGNLPRGRTARQERVAAAIGLFPALEGRLDVAAGRLSGGQQQMLAIGRALMREARVLIVDEATLGLHVSLHRPLLDALAAVASDGRAVVLIEEDHQVGHDIATTRYVLEAGVVTGVERKSGASVGA